MQAIMAVTVLAFAFSSLAVADIYTWTDARGVVHFTDTPPPDKRYRSAEVTAPVTVPMADNLHQQRRISKIHKQVQTIRLADRKRGSPENNLRAKANAKHQKNCASYRRKIARIQSQLRAGYSNNKGNSLHQKRRNLGQTLSRECILR